MFVPSCLRGEKGARVGNQIPQHHEASRHAIQQENTDDDQDDSQTRVCDSVGLLVTEQLKDLFSLPDSFSHSGRVQDNPGFAFTQKCLVASDKSESTYI